eukprot:gb/GECG01010437.1/.p1 GENE.gb/GECG01010437.1/~~gb/GECG01010437.1/.p1  ORF type:complete len:501 (+),score=52.72 gb/GECG01010437.1/:1-1503(+)
MGNFLSAVSKRQWDADELFSYSTKREVRIRDGYLGFFYFFCILIVISYVGIYQIIVNQQYRELADVASSHRVQLLNPLKRDNETDIPYCLDHKDQTYGHLDGDMLTSPKPCRYWDDQNVRYPAGVSGELFITTNVFQQSQKLADDTCFDPSDRFTCSYETVSNTTFYPAEPEWFRIRIVHSMVVPLKDRNYNSEDIDGKLLDKSGKQVDACSGYDSANRECPTSVKQSFSDGKPDEFPLRTLLNAAGISDMDNEKGRTKSIREDGTVLQFDIHYDNFFTYSPRNVRYSYRIRHLKETVSQKQQALDKAQEVMSQNRLLLTRLGVTILITTSSNIGYFSFQLLLVQIVTSVVLIVIAQFIADCYALYVHKMKYIYRQYQTISSVKYSDIEHLPDSEIRKFRTEDLINPQPRIFDKTDGEFDNFAGSAGGSTHGQEQQNDGQAEAIPYDEYLKGQEGDLEQQGSVDMPRRSPQTERVNPIHTAEIDRHRSNGGPSGQSFTSS